MVFKLFQHHLITNVIIADMYNVAFALPQVIFGIIFLADYIKSDLI